MQRLGAVPLIPLVCGDEVDDFGTEQELDPWLDKLYQEVFGIGPYEERLTLAYEDEGRDFKGFEEKEGDSHSASSGDSSNEGSNAVGNSKSSSLRMVTKRRSLDATITQLSVSQIDELRGRKKAVQGQRYAVHQLSRGSADAWRLIAKSLKRYDVELCGNEEGRELDRQLAERKIEGIQETEGNY